MLLYEWYRFTCVCMRVSYALSPPSDEKSSPADSDFASWCGWHNDHGSLTGLTSAMYIDNATGLECSSPHPDNGLYIRSRQGAVVKAVIPVDCLAFQMGESQQIHSGGVVQATPHCVHATSDPKLGAGISRETFALFMEPMPEEVRHCAHQQSIHACHVSSCLSCHGSVTCSYTMFIRHV